MRINRRHNTLILLQALLGNVMLHFGLFVHLWLSNHSCNGEYPFFSQFTILVHTLSFFSLVTHSRDLQCKHPSNHYQQPATKLSLTSFRRECLFKDHRASLNGIERVSAPSFLQFNNQYIQNIAE